MSANPVDDVKAIRPLVKALHRQVDACAAALPDAPADRRRDIAAAWVYSTVLVAWAEDHGLVDPWLRKGAADDRAAISRLPGGAQLWLSHAVASLAVHPSTRCLVDRRWNPACEATPTDEWCRGIADWWSTEAPSLRYEVEAGPASITGWLPGDLLQAVSDERRKGNALCQTPWWIADGILDRTLLPACAEFAHEPVIKLIDPTAGTGHFLSRAVDYLWEWYTTGALQPRQMRMDGVTGGPQLEPAEAAHRILAGVTGTELDPLTAAVCRLRMVVAAGELLHRAGLLPVLRLDTIPHDVKPRVIVADSLLAGKIPPHEYARLHPKHAAIYGLSTEEPAPTPTPAPQPAAPRTEQLNLLGEVA